MSHHEHDGHQGFAFFVTVHLLVLLAAIMLLFRR